MGPGAAIRAAPIRVRSTAMAVAARMASEPPRHPRLASADLIRSRKLPVRTTKPGDLQGLSVIRESTQAHDAPLPHREDLPKGPIYLQAAIPSLRVKVTQGDHELARLDELLRNE